MDDILFGNNNQATINRLAKRSYRANKQRNVFVTIALFLTAFMITSVFSLGCSYFETYQMQQIRAMGTTADDVAGLPFQALFIRNHLAGNWRSDACGHYILYPRTLPRP